MAKIIDFKTREVLYNEESIETPRYEGHLSLVVSEEEIQPKTITVKEYVDLYLEHVKSLNFKPGK